MTEPEGFGHDDLCLGAVAPWFTCVEVVQVGMESKDGGPYAELNPASREFVVLIQSASTSLRDWCPLSDDRCETHLDPEVMTSDVMAPPPETDIRGRRRELWLEVKAIPSDLGILQGPSISVFVTHGHQNDRLTPEKPTGYRCDPGPAKREKVNGRLDSLPESRKWKWFNIQSGSIPGVFEYVPCCQSSHQKSIPSSSSEWWRTLK